jgi:putative inorganic carbon (HCO3(-)) transporter
MLSRNLQTSVFLGPLLRLSQWPAAMPGVLQGLSALRKPLFALPVWLVLPVFALYLTSFTILDTGPIGLLTWGLLALAWLGGRRVRWTATDGWVLLFYLTAVVATGFSSYFSTSVEGLLKFSTLLAGYTAFRWLLPPQLGIWWMLALLGVTQTGVGLYQWVNHVQPLATWADPSINPELQMTRVFGTLQPYNPNLLAGFLIPCGAAALGLTGHAVLKRAWGPVTFWALATGLIVAGLVLTGSRGGYLALGGMAATGFMLAGVMVWRDFSGKAKAAWLLLALGAVAVVGIALLASPALQHRVASIFAMREDSSNAYRLNVYGSVLQMIAHNPWVGIGPGNSTFKLVYGLYMVPGYTALSAYSVPLEIAAEQGLPGLLVFILLLVGVKLRTLLFVDEQGPSPAQKWQAVFLFTGLVGSLLYGAFDTIWYRPAVNLLFWLMLAAWVQQTTPQEDPQ